MKDRYTSWNDIAGGSLFGELHPLTEPRSNRLYPMNRWGEHLYDEITQDYPTLSQFSQKTDPVRDALARDLFSLLFVAEAHPNNNRTPEIEADVRNRKILSELSKSDDYMDLQSLCTGKELPAIAACEAFMSYAAHFFSDLFQELNRYLEIYSLLKGQATELSLRLSLRRELQKQQGLSPQEEKQTVSLANKADRKLRQLSDIRQKLDDLVSARTSAFKDIAEKAAADAVEKAEKMTELLHAWGDGSGNMQNIPANRDLAERVKNSPNLLEIARTLGRYRELLLKKRKSGFSYGLGEKFDITTGNDLNRCLSSELALIAAEETQPLFIRKYENRLLKQYRKRIAVTKGEGDIIFCADESGSTREITAWIKAFGLALLDIASHKKRKFAMVHFASASNIKTDIFAPGKYTQSDVMDAVEHFYGGGTNFEAPLNEAARLLTNGFENADIVFVTDGDCRISDDFAKRFKETITSHKCSVTGILLNDGNPDAGTNLKPFCDTVYTTSDLSADAIALAVIGEKSA